MLRAALILVGLATVAAPALASDGVVDDDIGTCLAEGGVWVGPWTDPTEPACGDDCGEAEVDTLCDGPDDCLTVAEDEIKMPAPQGPRCLEYGPECGPRDEGGTSAVNSLLLAGPTGWGMAPPRLGTLPGADPIAFFACGIERDLRPPVPPPR